MCIDNCELLKHTYKFPKWNEATIGEIKALVAILLSIGLVHQQVLQDYWSSFECVGCSSALYATPYFRIYHTCDNFFSAYRRWKEAN